MRADVVAALTGATIVLPQGVAFAAIAGLPPEYGFYSAMITTDYCSFVRLFLARDIRPYSGHFRLVVWCIVRIV